MTDWEELHSVRLNFLRSRSRWPSPRRARARAWMACWEYHQGLRRRDPQWWRPPMECLDVTNGSVSIRCLAHDPDTMTFEVTYGPSVEHPPHTISARLEGAELRRLARWLYAGTIEVW